MIKNLGTGAGLQVMNNIQIGFDFSFGVSPLTGRGFDADWVNFFNNNLSFTATYLFGK